MNARAKFKKMADEVRLIIPDRDEPFWNFYRNTLSSTEPALITIPLTFNLQGREVARADFRCLPSPHQLLWLAVDLTLRSHPRLQWDEVAVNNSQPYARAAVTDALAASAAVKHAQVPARSAFALLNQFNMAMRAIYTEESTPLDVRRAYDDAHARMAAQICAGAYDVQWKKGGPGWLPFALPGLRRG